MSIKVFDLIPVLQRLDQVKTAQIECFHYSNTILCIGTSDGHILRYSINKSNYLGENVGFKSDFVDYKLVSPRRQPINLITIIPDLQKILFLSDGVLNVNNFHDLEPSQTSTLRLKNVTTYCYSEKYDERLSPFGTDVSILCVCIKSKNLQIYTIENNEVNFYKEIVLPSLCLRVEINKNSICVASDNAYLIADIIQSTVQTLFSYDIENFTPFITNSTQGEFLLNCQGDLGMFASVDGQTTRPPLPWCQNCTKFQIFNPYVLCSSNDQDDSIKVFNLTDLKLKQEISLGSVIKHLKYVSEDKFVFVSTHTQIFILNRTSMLFQVEQLLIKKQVDEAITLFDCLSVNLSKTDYEEQMQKIKTKCAFIELLDNKNYSKSEQLFLEANLDYKKLVAIIPGYSSYGSCLEEEDQTVDKYKTYFTENKNDEQLLQSVKSLCVSLMLKSKKLFKDEEFVCVLLKLCIETNQAMLNQIEFFTNLPINFCLQNIQVLNESKRFHSVACIYYLVDQYENAFEIWRNICDGKIVDAHFPGFEFMIEQLAACKDHQLVWKYVDWSMQVDEVRAVEIFTKRSSEELVSERMRVDVILECLQNYRQALTIYLEYLIYTKNIKKEKFNTQLVNIYLENIIELLKEPAESQTSSEWIGKFEKARGKFQGIIESAINFRVNTILVKVKEYEASLQKECAILYGRIEEHEKALKILVYTLGDYTAAINYCMNNSRDSAKSRKQLFNILFSIYTNPNYKEKDKLIKPALELLNSKLIGNFDLPRLLDMIPNNWSTRMTGEFLQSALNTNLARKRNLLAQKNIALNYKFTLQTTLFNLKQEQLYVGDDSDCFKCGSSLDSTLFVRYPNGKLSHKMCKGSGGEIKSSTSATTKRLDF